MSWKARSPSAMRAASATSIPVWRFPSKPPLRPLMRRVGGVTRRISGLSGGFDGKRHTGIDVADAARIALGERAFQLITHSRGDGQIGTDAPVVLKVAHPHRGLLGEIGISCNEVDIC